MWYAIYYAAYFLLVAVLGIKILRKDIPVKKNPEARVLTLDRVMQFSVGAGTQVASVNIKLENITSRDLEKGQSKRAFAVHMGQSIAQGMYVETFGKIDDTRLQTIVSHQEDSVTCEVWVRGPEMRKVNIPVGEQK